MTEPILDPDLPIIDPHHHLWDLRGLVPLFPEPRDPFVETVSRSALYGFEQLLSDARSGHNVIGTVFVECEAFYRAGASEALKSVGEVEYVNGVAAQSASGYYGPFRACAGIVGHADLALGDQVRPVLEALIAAGNGRLCGIRHRSAWDPDRDVLGPSSNNPPDLYTSDRFHAGFRHLDDLGLSFDAWVLEPQLGDVIALARAFPRASIVLDHCGTPLNIASYTGKLAERFDAWRASIRELAQCPNVTVKLGGLGMPCNGMPEQGPESGLGSEALAALWRPYIETCIEAFGPERGMFESNYPVDRWAASYPVLWNTFKRLSAGASDTEKRALFAGTAARVYKLDALPG